MIHSVIKELLPDIRALSFAGYYLSNVGGIVYPFNKKIKQADNSFIIKKFPIYAPDYNVACINGKYMDMVPDDSLGCVIYFEATPEVVVEGCGTDLTTDCTVTLVGWFNLPKLTNFLADGQKYLRILTQLLVGSKDIIVVEPLHSPHVHAVFTAKEFTYQDASIFSKWSYDEAEKQYLMYPRDFGSIVFDVQLTYSLCENENIPIVEDKCPVQ